MLFCLCVIAAQAVTVSSTSPITAGNAMDVTSTNPLTLDFSEPQGWLVFKPDGQANVKISIGVKETSYDSYTWRYSDRSDGVFMMGKYRYARVIIYTDWRATIHYQAGYLDTSVALYKCSSLSVGRNFKYNSETGGSSFDIAFTGTSCFVDSYIDVKGGLRVSGGTDPTAKVRAYVVTQTGGAKEYTGTSFMTGSGAYFTNLGATEATVSTTKVESVNPDESTSVNYGDIEMSTYTYPVRVTKSTKTELTLGNCTSYRSCKAGDDDDDDGKTGLPTSMVIMIVVICIICLLPAFIVPICICGIGCCAACVAMGDRDTQKRGRRRSSSSSSSSRRKISQTVVVGSDNHGEPPMYDPEVPYYNQGTAAPQYPAPYPPAPPVYQGYGVPQQYPGYPPAGNYAPQAGAYPPPDLYPPPQNPYA